MNPTQSTTAMSTTAIDQFTANDTTDQAAAVVPSGVRVEEELVEETLVDEVSIDGMCGVY